MKLRILGNKLRFRVSQEEAQKLENGERIFETIEFNAQATLTYQLVVMPIDDLTVTFSENIIEVGIPHEWLKGWNNDDRVGFYGNVGKLDISIEKDFQCLHKRPGEDESDNFTNPSTMKRL